MKTAKRFSAEDRFFLTGTLLAMLCINVCSFVSGLEVLPQGPAVAIAEVTRSIANHGSMSPQYFADVFTEASTLSKVQSTYVWQDVFSISEAGVLVPKHSIFSSVFAAPFYLIFGELGFWIMQQLFFLLLLVATYQIVKQSTGSARPWATLITTLLLSQSIFYCYSFSYDLHGAALVMAGLWALPTFPLLGAVIMALSIFVRPSFVLLVLPLLMASISLKDIKSATRIILGAALVAACFGLYNNYNWGSPLLTAYSSLPRFMNGEMLVKGHHMGFDFKELCSNWGEKLFSSKGLLPFNLALLALPVLVLRMLKTGSRQHWIWMCTVLAYTTFIFSYKYWWTTSGGNRFLLPAIYLYIVLLLIYVPRIRSGKR